jgi:GH24 family phage-related lysozyme (muramidase)
MYSSLHLRFIANFPMSAPAPITWTGSVSSAGSAPPAENIVLSEELERKGDLRQWRVRHFDVILAPEGHLILRRYIDHERQNILGEAPLVGVRDVPPANRRRDFRFDLNVSNEGRGTEKWLCVASGTQAVKDAWMTYIEAHNANAWGGVNPMGSGGAVAAAGAAAAAAGASGAESAPASAPALPSNGSRLGSRLGWTNSSAPLRADDGQRSTNSSLIEDFDNDTDTIVLTKTGRLEDKATGKMALIKNDMLKGQSNWRKAAQVLAFYAAGFAFYHFQEGMSLTDAVYFITVSVTTVGYGDLYPLTQPGMVFSIFYLFGGLALVGALIADVGAVMMEKAEAVLMARLDADPDDDEEPSDLWQIAIAAGALLLTLLIGVVFFAFSEGGGMPGGWCESAAVSAGRAPGESGCWQDPWLHALYFCIVTMTTIGYGDLSPQHVHSRWFCIFFILLSTVMFANALDQVAQVYAQRRAEEKVQAFLALELDIQQILDMDESGDGKVDKGEFLNFGLVMQGIVEADDPDVKRIMEAFDEYDKDGSGSLDHADLEQLLAEEESGRRERKKTMDRHEAEAAGKKRTRSIWRSSRKSAADESDAELVQEMTRM